MPKKLPSPEEMAEIVYVVERRCNKGVSRDEAIKRAKISRATFYRYKDALGDKILPPIDCDWVTLSKTWSPPPAENSNSIRLTRIRSEIAAALKTAFAHVSYVGPDKIGDELRGFSVALNEAFTNYSRLTENALDFLSEFYLPGKPDKSFRSLLDDVASITKPLEDVAEAKHGPTKSLGETGMGPRRDPRVGQLVMALAHIFQNHYGKEPTHTYTDLVDRHTSPFNLFVESIRDHFLKNLNLPKSAFVHFQRHTAARINWPDESH